MARMNHLLAGGVALAVAASASAPAEAKLRVKIKIPRAVVAFVAPAVAIAAVVANKPLKDTTIQVEAPKLTPANLIGAPIVPTVTVSGPLKGTEIKVEPPPKVTPLVLLGVPPVPHVTTAGLGPIGDVINGADKLTRTAEKVAQDAGERAADTVKDGLKGAGKAVEKAATWPFRAIDKWWTKMTDKAKAAGGALMEKGREIVQGFVNQAFALAGLVILGLAFMLMIAREYPRRRLA